MKIRPLFFFVFAASLLTLASAASRPPRQNKTATTQCNVRAYVLNGGPNGVNLRAAAGKSFKLAGRLPTQKVEGVVVHITGASGEWMRIDKATEEGGSTDRVLFRGAGWINAGLLGVSGKAIDNGATSLYQSKSKQSAVVIAVPGGDDAVKIRGCDGGWLFVEYQQKTGWAAPDTLCANSLTTCV
ncbi:MAG TPA: hypothetical protein VE961_01450 [Pyrinomonadaceae bacterium]|nr:hypothetical protein [Pyrinomonadaceae bacterium]